MARTHTHILFNSFVDVLLTVKSLIDKYVVYLLVLPIPVNRVNIHFDNENMYLYLALHNLT